MGVTITAPIVLLLATSSKEITKERLETVTGRLEECGKARNEENNTMDELSRDNTTLRKQLEAHRSLERENAAYEKQMAELDNSLSLKSDELITCNSNLLASDEARKIEAENKNLINTIKNDRQLIESLREKINEFPSTVKYCDSLNKKITELKDRQEKLEEKIEHTIDTFFCSRSMDECVKSAEQMQVIHQSNSKALEKMIESYNRCL